MILLVVVLYCTAAASLATLAWRGSFPDVSIFVGAALTTMVSWAAAASGSSMLRAGPFAAVWGIAVISAVAFFQAVKFGTTSMPFQKARARANGIGRWQIRADEFLQFAAQCGIHAASALN